MTKLGQNFTPMYYAEAMIADACPWIEYLFSTGRYKLLISIVSKLCIFDPTCGSGNVLLAASHYVNKYLKLACEATNEKFVEWHNLVGIEIDSRQAHLAKLRVHATILNANSLDVDYSTIVGPNTVVIANLPFYCADILTQWPEGAITVGSWNRICGNTDGTCDIAWLEKLKSFKRVHGITFVATRHPSYKIVDQFNWADIGGDADVFVNRIVRNERFCRS